MGRGAYRQFAGGFGERDVKPAFALTPPLQQELQRDRRLSGTGIALQKEHAIPCKPALQHIVQTFDACRREGNGRLVAADLSQGGLRVTSNRRAVERGQVLQTNASATLVERFRTRKSITSGRVPCDSAAIARKRLSAR